MGTEMDPGSYDDEVAQQREALQASVDATVEVLLGSPVDEVKQHLHEQFASRGLNTRPDEIDDLASVISAGEHPVYGASFVEEIRVEDTESDGALVYPRRRTPWRRLGGGSHATVRPELDDSWYHSHLDWPEGLNPRQAFVHSGMYVGWLITRGLVREYVFRGARGEEVLRGFHDRQVTGPELYEQWFGGRLRAPMLTEEGERFTRDYYLPDAGPFMKDFQRLFTMELPSSTVPRTHGRTSIACRPCWTSATDSGRRCPTDVCHSAAGGDPRRPEPHCARLRRRHRSSDGCPVFLHSHSRRSRRPGSPNPPDGSGITRAAATWAATTNRGVPTPRMA